MLDLELGALRALEVSLVWIFIGF